MKYEISEEVINALLNYLSTRPYAEVLPYINALQTVVKIEDAKPEVAKKEEKNKDEKKST